MIKAYTFLSFVRRYAFGCLFGLYIGILLILHAVHRFPAPGPYDSARLVGSPLCLEGKVISFPTTKWSQTRFVLEGHAVPWTAFSGRTVVTLNFPALELSPGDFVRVHGWLSDPREPSAKRTFDERGYWESFCVYSMLKVYSRDRFELLRPVGRWTLDSAAWHFHNAFRDFWDRHLWPDEASLLLGITLGARGALPAEIKDACMRAGVYHIVVVSGQSMAMIVALGVSLLRLLRVPFRRTLWICAPPIVFYCCAVGADPPVVRAATMALIGLGVTALGRDIPRAYPLLLAAAWILVREPETLFGASFQLSFGATACLLWLLPLWSQPWVSVDSWAHRLKRWFLEMGGICLAVHLGIGPILVYYFHRLSLIGLLANWTVFPLAGIVMVMGLTVGIWGVLWPASVPTLAIKLTGLAVHGLLELILHMSAWTWAAVSLPAPSLRFFVIYYTVLFGILFLIYRRRIHALPFSPGTRQHRLQSR